MYVRCAVILIDRIFTFYIIYNNNNNNNNNTLLSAFFARSLACGRVWNSMPQAVCVSVWISHRIWSQSVSLQLRAK